MYDGEAINSAGVGWALGWGESAVSCGATPADASTRAERWRDEFACRWA